MNLKTLIDKLMYRSSHFVIILLLLSIILTWGCKADIFSDCQINPSFQTQVLPIIEMHCSTPICHGFGGFAPFQLLTHFEIDSAVVNTDFLLTLRHQTPYPMPRIDPFLPDAIRLPDSLIQIITCWVEQGRPNN
jgi:hypothetical protein